MRIISSVLGVLLLSCSSSAMAGDCASNLLGNKLDSRVHYLPFNGQLDASFPDAEVISLVTKSCGISHGVTIHNTACRLLIPNELHSRVCIVETTVGYFFYSQDMMDNTILIFNRWD